jgi:WD40 repeat protein
MFLSAVLVFSVAEASKKRLCPNELLAQEKLLQDYATLLDIAVQYGWLQARDLDLLNVSPFDLGVARTVELAQFQQALQEISPETALSADAKSALRLLVQLKRVELVRPPEADQPMGKPSELVAKSEEGDTPEKMGRIPVFLFGTAQGGRINSMEWVPGSHRILAEEGVALRSYIAFKKPVTHQTSYTANEHRAGTMQGGSSGPRVRALAANGKFVVTGNSNTMSTVHLTENIETWQELRPSVGHRHLTEVFITPSQRGDSPDTIWGVNAAGLFTKWIWAPKDKTLVKETDTQIQISPDVYEALKIGDKLVTLHKDGALRVFHFPWDAQTSKTLKPFLQYKPDPAKRKQWGHLTAFPDGKRILVSPYGKEPWVFDLDTAKEPFDLEGRTTAGFINPVFSVKHERIFAPTDKGLMVWHLNTGKIIQVIKFQKIKIGHHRSLKNDHPDDLIQEIALTKDEEFFVGGTFDGVLGLWETASGVLCRAWDVDVSEFHRLRFSEDGKVLAASGHLGFIGLYKLEDMLK